MFTKLPDLFEKNFAIGFFLPVITFAFISISLLGKYELLPQFLKLNTASQTEFIFKIGIITLFSWLASILLLVTNTDLIRFVAGYGKFNPFRLFNWLEKKRYIHHKNTISKLNKEYVKNYEINNELQIKEIQEKIDNIYKERNKFMLKMVEMFPDKEDLLLPTSFGNIIRAFEVYSRIMYGLDAIPGWKRVITVVPENYRKLVDAAKAQVDFWINSWFLALLTLLEYIVLSSISKNIINLWIPFLLIFVIWLSYSRAKYSAVYWGEYVKSTFDIFLPELRIKLGGAENIVIEEERKFWEQFSKAVLYRDKSILDKIND